MKEAFKQALKSIKSGGGPFGAIIVCNGKIISRAGNKVVLNNDSTAHAEIEAIRKAEKKLKTFDLGKKGCELYSTCKPCPMCFSAAHWARIKKIYYCCSSEDAAKFGFDDKMIFDILKGTKKPKFKISKIECENKLNPFKEWEKKNNRIDY